MCSALADGTDYVPAVGLAMHRLQAAVVGTGFIGPVHIEALRRLRVNVRGVLGSSGEKTRAAAALHAAPTPDPPPQPSTSREPATARQTIGPR